jgi:hypothetical protein
VSAERIANEEIAVGEGPARSYVMDPDFFRVELRDRCGRALHTIQTWDPRVVRYYAGSNAAEDAAADKRVRERTGDPTAVRMRRPSRQSAGWDERLVKTPTARTEIIVPVVPGLTALSFSCARGPQLGGVSVEAVLDATCRRGAVSAESCWLWRAGF